MRTITIKEIEGEQYELRRKVQRGHARGTKCNFRRTKSIANNMAKKAVITLHIIDKHGEKCTCNMIESLDKTFGRLQERIADLERKGLDITGNLILQFVEED